MSSEPACRLALLGGFHLVCGGEMVTTVNKPRLQSLLAYLSLHRNGPQSRRQIAFSLWPDLSESRARANLRKLVFQVQQALPAAAQLVRADALTLQWMPDSPVALDVAEFEAEAASPAGLRRAFDLYGGDLLPDCYDDWIVPERERLRQIYLEVLERLIQQLEDDRDYSGAQRFIQHLLQSDPLREEVHRHLMRLHLHRGDRAAALRAYQDCVTILRRELDVEPSPATRQVYEQLVQPRELAAGSLPLVSSWPLVGRDAEWAWLQREWQKATLGKPHMVLITGDAGIGKTRLAEELLAWVDRQGVPVASSHCYAAESPVPYAPLTNWLRERPLRHLQPVWLGEVARLVPEVVDWKPDGADSGPLTQPWQRQRFREALARAVLGPDLARSFPLLLLLEDLHWCDGDTPEWLPSLLRLNPLARLLIVGTLRSDVPVAAESLATMLADLRRQGLLAEIELGPLTEPDSALLASHLLGCDVEAETSDALYRETEGNPLFIIEFLRAGLASGTPAGLVEARVLPPLVQAAVSARLAQLSPAARQVLELAAVMGGGFTFEMLALAGEQDEGTLVQAVDELWQRHVIRERGRDSYDFSHNKLGQVVYAQLSGTRRRWLHRRVAEALAAVSARHGATIDGRIGYHFEQAGDDCSAAHWLRRAGEMAIRVGALSEARVYFDRGLALTAEIDTGGHFAVLLARERLCGLEAAREQQARDLASLVRLAVAMDDGSREGARRRAEVAVEQARYWRETSQYSEALEAARSALDRIQEARARPARELEAGGRPYDLDGLEIEAYYLWGATLEYRGEYAQAIATLQKSLELAGALGLYCEQARALCGMAHVAPDMASSQGYLEKALPVFREAGDASGEAGCLDSLGYVYLWMGEYQEALACYQQSLQLARQIHYHRCEVNVLFHLGHFHNHMGDYVRGKGYLERALVMAQQEQDRRRIAYHLISVGVSERGLGVPGVARERVREALALFQAISDSNGETIAWYSLGLTCMALAQWDEAIPSLQRAMALASEVADPTTTIHCQVLLARALLSQGDLPGAREQIEQALSYYDDGGDVSSAEEGPLPFYAGCYHVLRAEGNPRAAEMLEKAHAYLQSQAARIPDDALRRTFLQEKRVNRDLMAAWRQEHDPAN